MNCFKVEFPCDLYHCAFDLYTYFVYGYSQSHTHKILEPRGVTNGKFKKPGGGGEGAFPNRPKELLPLFSICYVCMYVTG